MVTQKDLQELVTAINGVLADLNKRIAALEEAAAKQSSTTRAKKSTEKA